MIVSVIGCGSSGKDWKTLPCNLSIGVNDMYKFGHSPDWLVVVNMPRKFESERLRNITATKPKRFLTHAVRAWSQHIRNKELEYLKNMTNFHSRVTLFRPNYIYTSQTSPIVAMSLAYNAGAKEIILWGVDFRDHSKYREGTTAGDREIKVYQHFISLLEKKGIKVYLGSPGSALDKFVPVYKKECHDMF